MFENGTSTRIGTIARLGAYGVIFVAFIWWIRWGYIEGLSTSQTVPGCLQAVLALVISSATHEIGHAGVAYLLGLRIFTLTIGPLHWRIHDDGWNFEFRSTNLISGGGSVGVSPIDGGNSRWRDICLFAAGSFANLLLGCIALWATLTAKGRPWEPAWELLAFTATISLTSAIINLIPVRTDATCSDGAHMRQLFRIGPWIDVHRAFSMVNSGMFTPLRPRDFDIEVIQRAARFVTRGRRAMDLRLFLFWHFFDAQQIPEALGALREAELVYEESPNIIGDLHANFIVGYALLKHDAERARWWWDRMEAQKVVPRNADYLMARCALLWSEGHIEWAWRAWEEGNAMVKSLPDAGAYEFDRSCFNQLRQALDAATSAARPDLNWVAPQSASTPASDKSPGQFGLPGQCEAE